MSKQVATHPVEDRKAKQLETSIRRAYGAGNIERLRSLAQEVRKAGWNSRIDKDWIRRLYRRALELIRQLEHPEETLRDVRHSIPRG